MSLLDELDIDPEDFHWKDLGLCQKTGVVIKPDGTVIDNMFDEYETNERVAKQVDQMCLHCPVMAQCAQAGSKGEWGVWGGIYWNGAGKPDKNKNSHKTPEVWDEIKKRMTE